MFIILVRILAVDRILCMKFAFATILYMDINSIKKNLKYINVAEVQADKLMAEITFSVILTFEVKL